MLDVYFSLHRILMGCQVSVRFAGFLVFRNSQIKAISDLEFIEVQTGYNLVEEDIVRISMTWDEVMEHVSSPI